MELGLKFEKLRSDFLFRVRLNGDQPVASWAPTERASEAWVVLEPGHLLEGRNALGVQISDLPGATALVEAALTEAVPALEP